MNLPFSSLATIPKPNFFSCKSNEVSQFNLIEPRGGGGQIAVSDALSLSSCSSTRPLVFEIPLEHSRLILAKGMDV